MTDKLRHLTPCSECPWRRKHPAGWLGGYPPEDFINQVQLDGPPVPCHKTIPPGSNMDSDAGRVSMCAGALIFMRNSCKSAQHPDYGDALEKVEADPVNVFQWPHEFLAYHRDKEGWVKRAVAQAKAEREAADPLDNEDEIREQADTFLKRRRT